MRLHHLALLAFVSLPASPDAAAPPHAAAAVVQPRALRERAKDALGDEHHARAFHDVVVGNGAASHGALSELVDRWIAAQRAR